MKCKITYDCVRQRQLSTYITNIFGYINFLQFTHCLILNSFCCLKCCSSDISSWPGALRQHSSSALPLWTLDFVAHPVSLQVHTGLVHPGNQPQSRHTFVTLYCYYTMIKFNLFNKWLNYDPTNSNVTHILHLFNGIAFQETGKPFLSIFMTCLV